MSMPNCTKPAPPASSAAVAIAARAAVRRREILTGLRDELSAAAYLSVLSNGEIRLAEVVDSPATPRVELWVGFEDASHATAVGKAVLSALPAGDRRDYLHRHGLADLTPHTVTDPRVLMRQLGAGSSYAVDREEYALGTACVAVVVPAATPPEAVAVSVPTRRLPGVLGKSDALRRAAQGLALVARPVVTI